MVEQSSPDDRTGHQVLETQEALDIQTIARLERLERAVQRFPEDVQTAARVAFKVRASFQASADNTAEIWPVMQVKS